MDLFNININHLSLIASIFLYEAALSHQYLETQLADDSRRSKFSNGLVEESWVGSGWCWAEGTIDDEKVLGTDDKSVVIGAKTETARTTPVVVADLAGLVDK